MGPDPMIMILLMSSRFGIFPPRHNLGLISSKPQSPTLLGDKGSCRKGSSGGKKIGAN
jgi:hypothetical protein